MFDYDIKNPNLLISYNNESFFYHENQKPNIFRNAKLKFSNNNQLIYLNNFIFVYNKYNFRTTKIIGESKTKYYRKNNKLIMQDNGIKLKFIYQNQSLLGFIYNDKKYYYKKNYNNDIIGIYDANHILICRYVYDYLGNHKLIINNTLNYHIADINPFRFHSYYYDIETGLYYINGKYYDSEIGIYIN